MNSGPFTAISDALGAYSFPVSYRTREVVDDHFGAIAANIEREADLIRSYDQAHIAWMIHELFRFEMLCTKHGSFVDEREWRIVYSPDLDQRPVKHVSKSIEVINGSLLPDYNISIPAILDRV